MRIKLDENVPDRAVASLTALGHDIDTVAGEGLGGATDEDLWPKVQEAAPPAPTVESWCSAFRMTAAVLSWSGWRLCFAPKPSRPGLRAWSS